MPTTPSKHHLYVNVLFRRTLWKRVRAAAIITGYDAASEFVRAAVVEKLNRHRTETGMPLLDVRRHSSVTRKATKKRRKVKPGAEE